MSDIERRMLAMIRAEVAGRGTPAAGGGLDSCIPAVMSIDISFRVYPRDVRRGQ